MALHKSRLDSDIWDHTVRAAFLENFECVKLVAIKEETGVCRRMHLLKNLRRYRVKAASHMRERLSPKQLKTVIKLCERLQEKLEARLEPLTADSKPLYDAVKSLAAAILKVKKRKNRLPEGQADVMWSNSLKQLFSNEIQIAKDGLDGERHWRRCKSLLVLELMSLTDLLV